MHDIYVHIFICHMLDSGAKIINRLVRGFSLCRSYNTILHRSLSVITIITKTIWDSHKYKKEKQGEIMK